jgi:hypothetical protein
MQILAAVIKGTKPATQPSGLTEMEKEQWSLFENCWDEPGNRPNAAEVVNRLQALASLYSIQDQASPDDYPSLSYTSELLASCTVCRKPSYRRCSRCRITPYCIIEHLIEVRYHVD